MLGAGITNVPNIRPGSVLVATDFSPVSEKALQHALMIASQYRSKLYLMNVVKDIDFVANGSGLVVSTSELAWKRLEDLQQKLISSGAVFGLDHEVIVSEGEVWEEIERIVREKQIDLIVVGTHGRGGVAKLVRGSVAEQIFRRAVCPVLTVGTQCPTNPELNSVRHHRPLLFPTDFSAESLAALPHAVSVANEHDISLILLNQISFVPESEVARWHTSDDLSRLQTAMRYEQLNRLRRLVRNTDLATEPLCIAEFGGPVDGILKISKQLGVGSIVMGLKPRKHIDVISHLPWSTVYKVVCGAACSVFTISAVNNRTVQTSSCGTAMPRAT
jgi:nucleotide-binding universal stress UspA family protein